MKFLLIFPPGTPASTLAAELFNNSVNLRMTEVEATDPLTYVEVSGVRSGGDLLTTVDEFETFLWPRVDSLIVSHSLDFLRVIYPSSWRYPAPGHLDSRYVSFFASKFLSRPQRFDESRSWLEIINQHVYPLERVLTELLGRGINPEDPEVWLELLTLRRVDLLLGKKLVPQLKAEIGNWVYKTLGVKGLRELRDATGQRPAWVDEYPGVASSEEEA